MNRRFQPLLFALIALLITSCGGGGQSTSEQADSKTETSKSGEGEASNASMAETVADIPYASTRYLIEPSELKAKVQTADIVDGKDAATGLVVDDHWQTVKSNCTGCHSAKLITQNRMSAKRWRKTIKWMQETQNLWDLGKNEDKIVAYLGKNYAPEDVGRRAPLTNVEWYELK